MNDREKVIKALGFCLMPPSREELENDICSHEDCPYYREYNGGKCVSAVAKDALALLKAQEPRVLTLEEAKSASGYVFAQSRSSNILELQLIKDGFMYDSFGVPIAVDDLWWEGYNKHWRLWTSVPTDEQREAVKWDA